MQQASNIPTPAMHKGCLRIALLDLVNTKYLQQRKQRANQNKDFVPSSINTLIFII